MSDNKWQDKTQSASGRPTFHRNETDSGRGRRAHVSKGTRRDPNGDWQVVTGSAYDELIEQPVDSKEEALAIGDRWIETGSR